MQTAVNCRGDCVHWEDPSHDQDGDSSREKVDKGIFIGYFAQCCIVFELGDIVDKG